MALLNSSSNLVGIGTTCFTSAMISRGASGMILISHREVWTISPMTVNIHVNYRGRVRFVFMLSAD